MISLLHLNPAHAVEIARRPAWEMIFLWLLITDDPVTTTPLDLNYHKGDNKVDDSEEDSFAHGFEVVNRPFSFSISAKNKDDKKNADDKEHLLNTIVELMGLIVWEESIDVITSDEMYLKHVCVYSGLFAY